MNQANSYFVVMVATCFLLSDARGQLASPQAEIERPLDAMVKFNSWLEVFEDDFDLEVSAHFGAAEGSANVSHSETIFKCRQIYDAAGALSVIPWALGSAEVDATRGTSKNASSRRVRIVKGKDIKEFDFVNKAERRLGNCEECIQRVSPINLIQSVSNFMVMDLTIPQSCDLSVFMERLATLRADQLVTMKQKINGRDLLVYRIKSDPLPNSAAIPVYKIIVADGGFDSGLVREFHSGFMELTDTSQFREDSQVVERYGKYIHTVGWKEISLSTNRGKSRKLILPVSVSKKEDNDEIKYQSYFNMELSWKSFTGESKEMCEIEPCDKISASFILKIDNALGR